MYGGAGNYDCYHDIMKQVTLRLSEQLAAALKAAAAERAESVNSYASLVLAAAVDPELSGSDHERIRARLGRAGLLAESAAPRGQRPGAEELTRASASAGVGKSLSELISEGRA